MKERLKELEGRKVRITCVFGNSEPIFYSGIIKEVGEDFIVLLDKFKNDVLISTDSIKKIEKVEVKE